MNLINKSFLCALFGFYVTIFPSLVSASDKSSLSYSVTARRYPIGVSIIVTDSLGRRTGFNADTNYSVEDIPNSNKSFGGIEDDLTGEPGTQSMDVIIRRPVPPGIYQATVYGSTATAFFLTIGSNDSAGNTTDIQIQGVIDKDESQGFIFNYSPLPGSAITFYKNVTFTGLRQELYTFLKLGQLGNDKFVGSLAKNIGLAEKLSGVCDKRKARKDKCEPAIAVLKLFIKRLELANRKCDNPADCDEEREWSAFRKEHGRDDDYKDFFRDWDRDDWHKHKKQCKRFVTDEALKIIREDAKWLMRSLGGEIDKKHDNHGGGGKDR